MKVSILRELPRTISALVAGEEKEWIEDPWLIKHLVGARAVTDPIGRQPPSEASACELRSGQFTSGNTKRPGSSRGVPQQTTVSFCFKDLLVPDHEVIDVERE